MTFAKLLCMTMDQEDMPIVHRWPLISLGKQFMFKTNERVSCAETFGDFDFGQWRPGARNNELDLSGIDLSGLGQGPARPDELSDLSVDLEGSGASAEEEEEEFLYFTVAREKSPAHVAADVGCPNMFDTIKMGDGVRPICTQTAATPKTFSCAFQCRDPEQEFQGLKMVHCKGGVLSHKKGFNKCVSPPAESEMTACGAVTNKFKFLNGAQANCDGKKLCKPTCEDGAKPSRMVIKCRSPKKKMFSPKKGVVTCGMLNHNISRINKLNSPSF